MSLFHALTVADIRRETPEAVSVAFAVPAELSSAYRFAPGQYLTLRRDFAGEEVRRSYSISSGLDDGELRIAVKEVEGGLFSTFLNRGLSVGDRIEAMAPEGRFTVALSPGAPRHHLGVAAGSGITPVISIARTILAREPLSRFVLLYGNRRAASVIFRREIDDLKDRYLDRFTVFHVLSREGQDIDLLQGRLDGPRVATLARLAFGGAAVDHAFLCGPQAMTEAARASLADLGVAADRIHVELFTAGAPVTARRPKSATPVPTNGMIPLSITLDGATHALAVAPEETVIEAAARQGLELPWSCKGGMCCTCRAKIVAGEVAMDQNFSLEPWELAAGFVLTCQSRPVKGPISLDYDAA